MGFRFLAVLFVLASVLPRTATAGAWLRDPGRGFLAVSTAYNSNFEASHTAYFEWGLTARTTLGAKADVSQPAGLGLSGTATAFMRRPLLPRTKRATLSYEIGLGARFDDTAITPLATAFASYGRSFTLGARNGWVNVDAGVEFDLGGGGTRTIKLDGTVGLDLADRTQGMVQMFVSQDHFGTVSTTLTPSFIYKPKKGRTAYVVGLEAKRSNTTTYGIKLSLWQYF